MSQEKGMVSKDFFEEKELEQMLQGGMKVRQGEKREGDSRSVTCPVFVGSFSLPFWVPPMLAVSWPLSPGT